MSANDGLSGRCLSDPRSALQAPTPSMGWARALAGAGSIKRPVRGADGEGRRPVADVPGMPTFRRLLPAAAAAALVIALPTVTAGAAVRGNGNGNGNAYGPSKDKDKEKGQGNGNGNTPAQAPAASPPASTPGQPVPPGQAKKEQAGATTAPGQAMKEGAASGSAGTPADGTATTPGAAAPPTPIAAPAEPVLGKSMAVEPVSGRVQIRLPDSSGYVSLADAGSIPTGSVVDARRGTLTLQSALDASGRTQTATVRGALFEVRQSATGNGVTDLVLRGGPPASCTAARSGATGRIAAVATKKAKPGALWARDSHGRFRTRGRNSVATVRGTRWSTRETCAGTVTRVMHGAVDVRDLVTGRTVTVRAGHAYLARTKS
jgi:hypothetical protein